MKCLEVEAEVGSKAIQNGAVSDCQEIPGDERPYARKSWFASIEIVQSMVSRKVLFWQGCTPVGFGNRSMPISIWMDVNNDKTEIEAEARAGRIGWRPKLNPKPVR